MMRRVSGFMFCLLLAGFALRAQDPGSRSNPYRLEPTPGTVAWGYYWSQAKPVLRIRSGEWVRVHTLLTSSPERLERMGLPPGEVEKELRQVQSVKDRGPGGHILTGPIFVEGAEVGDVLEVRVDSIELAIPYAYNAIGSSGFLSDEIFERRSRLIRLDRKRGIAHFAPGIEVPLRPFFGSMGVAPPPEAGRFNSAPPWIHAGNLDNKEMVAGSVLYIPVHVPGALFEIGDGHAAQGNGEVDVTAIETSLIGLIRLTVRKDMHLEWPRAETPTHIITMGTDRNLTSATRIAVRQMIHYLMTERHLSRTDAYMLTSVVADVDITQLVDGRKGVHVMLPKNIFVASKN